MEQDFWKGLRHTVQKINQHYSKNKIGRDFQIQKPKNDGPTPTPNWQTFVRAQP